MKKIYSFLSLCLLFLGLTTATAQTAELKLTFDRTGDNVSVSVAGLDGVTASVVSKSHAWKDLGVANANTILCPNVNGNTDPTITWGLQINGVPANYKLNGVALDIHALNGAGQYQDPADAVARHWNVAIAQGGTTVANFADIEISQGTEEGRTMGNNHKVHSVAAAEALAATDPMTLDFTVTKGSENKGCFFGLSEVTLTYDVEEVVVEPVTFVKSTPAAGSTVETLSVFTMTFNKELASVDPEMMMMLYGGMNPIPSEVQINGTDAKTITVTLQEPYSLAGGYIYYIAAGSLVAADGSVNEEDIMLEYNIEAAPNSFGNVYSYPASGSTVESLVNVRMGFMGEVASVSKEAINVVDGNGTTVTTATLATDDFDFNAVELTLAQEITAGGTYKIVIPEGYINSAAGTYNPELTLTYTIEGAEQTEGRIVYFYHPEYVGFLAMKADGSESYLVKDFSVENLSDYEWVLEPAEGENRYYVRNKATGFYLGQCATSTTVTGVNEAAKQAYELSKNGIYDVLKDVTGSTYNYLHVAGHNVVVGWEAGAAASHWFLLGSVAEYNNVVNNLKSVEALNKALKEAEQFKEKSQPYFKALITEASQFSSNNKEATEGTYEGLLDGDNTTFFHSNWHGGGPEPHDLQVVLKNNEETNFLVKYESRNSSGYRNDRPVKMSVYGGTVGEDGTVTFEAEAFANLTTADGIGEVAGEFKFTADKVYDAFRFEVHETVMTDGTKGNVWFTYGEFQMYSQTMTPAEVELTAEQAAALDLAITNAQNANVVTDSFSALIEALNKAVDVETPEVPVVPTPVELVKSNPELETEVPSLSVITLTFNKEIASVDTTPGMFWFVDADMTNMYDAEVQINATDAKTLTITLAEEIKEAGTYLAMFSQGALVAADGTSNGTAVEMAWTVKPAPAVEPLKLVSIDPANGSELSSVTKFTLTFNKPVTLKNAEGATLHANGGSTTLQVLVSETDAKEVVLAADKEITNSGSYELKVAEGTLEDADGGLNEALTFTYEVESSNNTLNVVKTDPDVNVPQESLKHVVLTFNAEVMDCKWQEKINVTDASGAVVATGLMDFTDIYEEVLISFNKEITTPGKYTVTVPENTIFGYGIFNPEISLTYTIGAEATTVVAVDPACGHYENMPANLKLTFSNDIKTLEFGMLRTDFTGVRGYTLAEEDYTIAGNELTINVPADYVNGAANMMLTLAVIDVNDQYVTYAYDEAELNEDYVTLMYTADMKSDLFVMESSDPEAGVVEKLDVINVTFGNGGYTYVGGFDKSKEVVVLNADEEVVAKAAMEVVEMTETEDGETYSWPTSTVKFTLDTPVTAAGEYTLVIPEATVYNEGYYEEADDFGASYGAIYNPEVRIEYTIEGEVEVDYTPTNNGTKTRSDRNVTAVKLNSVLGNNVYDLTSTERSQDYTDATAVATFKVAAGEELTAVVEHAGEWVHHAVYVDLEGDGFQSSIEEGSEWKPAGDLMAYAFYNNGGSSDEYGYNSVGTSISGQGRHMPSLPAFNAPAQPGTYRMRFVQTWCSIDPNGDADGKFGDFKANGDQIVDVLLEVTDATGISAVDVDNINDVYTLDGRKVNVKAGQKLNKGIYIVGGKKVYVK